MMQDIHGAKGGGKGGGGSQRVAVEDPNTLRSASTARIIDMLGEGPIVGLVDGLKSVYVDNTPVQAASGQMNFSGITIDTRDGYPAQTYLPGFSAVETEVYVNAQVKAVMPIVRTVQNPAVNAVRVTVQVPALTSQNQSNGDLNGTSVAIAIDARTGGGAWQELRTDTISGKTTSPYQRSYRINLPGAAPWEIRLRRLTADSEKAALRNDTWFYSYTEIIDAKLSYPDSALVGIEVDARQFGSQIPSRSYDVKGIIIPVPSNYDPETRVYSGLWDGTFKQAWTDNTAWHYYNLATNKRYGAGIEDVDKWGLYQIAQYCDERVSDGYGGEEPRFTFNTVLANKEDAIKALQNLASVFRGMTYWGTNSVMAVADMPADPVRLVTPANVIDGEFEYSGTALKNRHSVALVTWNDPADNYKKQIEVVEDAEAIEQYGWREAEVVAFGCTSRGQAHRFGRWLLFSERTETETVSYVAGTDHADLRPGDVIQLSDPGTAGARLSGRLRETGTSTLQLDAVPDAVQGQVWQLDVILPAGTVERRTVASWDADNRITLSEPLSAAPVAHAVWMLSSTSVQPRLFRVISNSERDGGTYAITAMAHNPGKYAAVEQGLALPEPDTSLLPTGELPPPLDITLEEYLYQAGPMVRSGATISVQLPMDPRISATEVEVWRPADSGYASLGYISGSSVDISDTLPGEYKIRARTISVVSRSAWREQSFSLLGLMAPPTDVADLQLVVNSGQLLLNWPPVTDLDLSHYRLKYSADPAATWASAQDIAPYIAAGTTSITLPARNGAWLIKAVDASGNESLLARRAELSSAELVNANVVELVDEPNWPGTPDSVYALDGELRLMDAGNIAGWSSLAAVPLLSYGADSVSPEGYYYADEVVDLGHVYPCRLAVTLSAMGVDLLNTLSTWASLSDVDQLDASDVSQWDIRAELSISHTAAAAAPADWGDWQPLTIGEYTGRAFRFRLRLRSFAASVTPAVSAMAITVDMPDRVADGQDLVCPPQGLRVSFAPPFMARPSLAVDAQGLLSGERKVITNITDTGFDLQFLDEQGAGVSRTFDYLAKGYGRRIQ
ncbi:host specificity protein J [Oceanisphaera sp. KMM 10153]|uniref:host specificity protein J n=1 Tax=Oceanisphaera submarina TaxID=3390193 RepID=UPI00397639FF